MFHWTDTDVSNLVKFALQSVRTSAADFLPGAIRERLIAAVADQLSATTWNVHVGRLDLDAAGHGPQWLPEAASNQGERDQTFHLAYSTLLVRLQKLVREYGCECDELTTRKWMSSQLGPQHVIAWITVRPDGSCECIEFCKSMGSGEFTARDEAVLRVLATELLAQPQSSVSHVDGQESRQTMHLPRRQREVLSRLLQGLSVKEIAGELGISPYTVNDYIKAIYRRYQVCSRGELLAAVHGLRKQPVPR